MAASFVLGLWLIPLEIWIDRRRQRFATADWPTLNVADANVRRTVIFVAVVLVNIAILS